MVINSAGISSAMLLVTKISQRTTRKAALSIPTNTSTPDFMNTNNTNIVNHIEQRLTSEFVVEIKEAPQHFKMK